MNDGEGNASAWSEELQALTRKLLEEGRTYPLRGQALGLAMKHIDDRYGYIDAMDLALRRWRIRAVEGDENREETFETITDLLAAGWAVD